MHYEKLHNLYFSVVNVIGVMTSDGVWVGVGVGGVSGLWESKA